MSKTWTAYALEFMASYEFKLELLAAAIPKALAESPESPFLLLSRAADRYSAPAALPLLLELGADPLARSRLGLAGSADPGQDELSWTLFDSDEFLNSNWTLPSVRKLLAAAASIPPHALAAAEGVANGDLSALEAWIRSGAPDRTGRGGLLIKRAASRAGTSLLPRLSQLSQLPPGTAAAALARSLCDPASVRHALAAGALAEPELARSAVKEIFDAVEHAASDARRAPSRRRCAGGEGAPKEPSPEAAGSKEAAAKTVEARSPGLEGLRSLACIEELENSRGWPFGCRLSERFEALAILAGAGADLSAPTSSGQSALELASERAELIQSRAGREWAALRSLAPKIAKDLRKIAARTPAAE